MKSSRNEADPDAVALVMTEMVTNSLRHGCPPVTVDLVGTVNMLVLCVSDGSGDKPLRPTARTGDEGGRGLTIFDALTSRWGVWLNPGGGKTVWCEFPSPDVGRDKPKGCRA
jgi:two-component sensor histidine kinase